MSFTTKKNYEGSIGILWSETGLVNKTGQVDVATAIADGDRKIIKAGTLYADDAITGVVFEDIDMTERDLYPIAITVAGHIRADRISADVFAKKAEFAAQGLFIHGNQTSA